MVMCPVKHLLCYKVGPWGQRQYYVGHILMDQTRVNSCNAGQHPVGRKCKLIPGDGKILVKVNHRPSSIEVQCNQLTTKQLLGFLKAWCCIKGSVLNFRKWLLGE